MEENSQNNEPKCFIKKDLTESVRHEIRKSVCNDLQANNKFVGNDYCIFHLPIKDKDIIEFNQVFQSKLDYVKQKANWVETLPDGIREREKYNLILDFRYVWFPSKIDRLQYDFETTVLFDYSTFCEEVDFWGNFHKRVFFNHVSFLKKVEFLSKFFEDASFNSTIFSGPAIFVGAKFHSSASFRSARFLKSPDYFDIDNQINFINVNFIGDADFGDVLFSSPVDFQSAVFSKLGYFRNAKFKEKVSFFLSSFLAESSFNFVTFSGESYFRKAKFKSYSDFNQATFTKKSDFSEVKFESYTDFKIAIFIEDVLFELAQFSEETDFRSTTFMKGAYFHRIKTTENSKLSFIWTSFQQLARFDEAIIKGYLHFEAGEGDIFDGKWSSPLIGDKRPEIEKRYTPVFEGRAEFHHIGAEKPERITFNKVRLRPNWFVNADSRKFIFTDISWENYNGKSIELKEELEQLERRDFQKPHNFRLLTISFRNLAANAEEFNRFEEASNFRKSASECERLERLYKQKESWRNLGKCRTDNVFRWDFFIKIRKVLKCYWYVIKSAKFNPVHFLYRWLSGYGERWGRAFVWLIIIWLCFALAFYLLGEFDHNYNEGHLEFWKSFGYSLLVMTLQKPDPRPLSTLTYIIYGFETIFAPLQAALLALAIRRKFMR